MGIRVVGYDAVIGVELETDDRGVGVAVQHHVVHLEGYSVG